VSEVWPVGSVISMGALRVRVEGELASTHEELWSRRRWAEPGTGVAAESQTAGVGRGGARWESPQGGLYVSVLAGAGMRAADADALGEAASLAVLQVASEVAPGVELFLKWPNDVVARLPRERVGKVAGVIVRAESDAERVLRAVVSVGVNLEAAVERVPGAPGPTVPASLEGLARRAGGPWAASRVQALEWMVGFLALDLERARVDPPAVRARYGVELRRSPLRARVAGVREAFRPLGVAPGGALLVRRESGRTAVVGVADAERLEWRWLREAGGRKRGAPGRRKAPTKRGGAKRAGAERSGAKRGGADRKRKPPRGGRAAAGGLKRSAARAPRAARRAARR